MVAGSEVAQAVVLAEREAMDAVVVAEHAAPSSAIEPDLDRATGDLPAQWPRWPRP
jgi:hypothetical protein